MFFFGVTLTVVLYCDGIVPIYSSREYDSGFSYLSHESVEVVNMLLEYFVNAAVYCVARGSFQIAELMIICFATLEAHLHQS